MVGKYGLDGLDSYVFIAFSRQLLIGKIAEEIQVYIYVHTCVHKCMYTYMCTYTTCYTSLLAKQFFFTKQTHRNQIFDDIHMRQWVDFNRLV